MNRLRSVLADPFVSSLVVLALLGLAGAVTLGLAWAGVAGSAEVHTQTAYLVSGGLGGLGLVGFALALLSIQHRRWAEARRRVLLGRAVDLAAGVLAAAQQDTTAVRPSRSKTAR